MILKKTYTFYYPYNTRPEAFSEGICLFLFSLSIITSNFSITNSLSGINTDWWSNRVDYNISKYFSSLYSFLKKSISISFLCKFLFYATFYPFSIFYSTLIISSSAGNRRGLAYSYWCLFSPILKSVAFFFRMSSAFLSLKWEITSF